MSTAGGNGPNDAGEQRCPTCGAAQAATSLECRRCKADLSLFASVLRLQEELERRALVALDRGEHERTLALARRRLEVSPDKEAARLLAVAHLVRGEFDQALAVYEWIRPRLDSA